MSDAVDADKVERVPPLNLTQDEAEALWAMVKVGIGDSEVYSEHEEDIESVHTKVKELVD